MSKNFTTKPRAPAAPQPALSDDVPSCTAWATRKNCRGAWADFRISPSRFRSSASSPAASLPFRSAMATGGGFQSPSAGPSAALFALVVAASLGQIASAYPTAGGLYHWSSILGGRGWGWVTAWINLLGLIFVVASVNVGVFLLFRDLVWPASLGIDVSALGQRRSRSSRCVRHHRDAGAVQPLRHSRDDAAHRLLGLSDFRRRRRPDADDADLGRHVRLLAPHHVREQYRRRRRRLCSRSRARPWWRSSSACSTRSTRSPASTPRRIRRRRRIDARRAVPTRHDALGVLVAGVRLRHGRLRSCWRARTSPPPPRTAAMRGSICSTTCRHRRDPQGLPRDLHRARQLSLCACRPDVDVAHDLRLLARRRPAGFKPLAPCQPDLAHAGSGHLARCGTLHRGDALFAGVRGAGRRLRPLPLHLLRYAHRRRLFAEGKSWTEFGPFRLGILVKATGCDFDAGVLVLMYAGIQPPFDILINYAIGLIVLLLVFWFGIERRVQRPADRRQDRQAPGGDPRRRGGGRRDRPGLARISAPPGWRNPPSGAEPIDGRRRTIEANEVGPGSEPKKPNAPRGDPAAARGPDRRCAGLPRGRIWLGSLREDANQTVLDRRLGRFRHRHRH